MVLVQSGEGMGAVSMVAATRELVRKIHHCFGPVKINFIKFKVKSLGGQIATFCWCSAEYFPTHQSFFCSYKQVEWSGVEDWATCRLGPIFHLPGPELHLSHQSSG